MAPMFCVLAASTAAAQPGAPPADLETLKRMVQEAISQNEELRRRIRELEQAIIKQEQATREAAKEAAKEAVREVAKEAPVEPASKEALEEQARQAKASKIQLGGALEVGVQWKRSFDRSSESSLKLETAEFDLEAKLVPWAKADLAIEWDRDNDKLTVNEALITLGEDYPVTLKAGRGTVPFGLSTGGTVAAKLEDTLTLTDPLTIEVFDAKEEFALLDFRAFGFHAGAYVFNGDTNEGGGDKRLEHYGGSIGYGWQHDILSVAGGLSYIDSVFDSDALSEAFPEARTAKYVPGIAAHVKLGLGGVSFNAGYYTAARKVRFVRDDNEVRFKPRAWHVEGGYTTEIFGAKTYAAIGYSETRQLAGAFAKKRLIGTVGRWLLENMRLTFDYSHDNDYSKAEGGTARSANAYTLRLTYEW